MHHTEFVECFAPYIIVISYVPFAIKPSAKQSIGTERQSCSCFTFHENLRQV